MYNGKPKIILLSHILIIKQLSTGKRNARGSKTIAVYSTLSNMVFRNLPLFLGKISKKVKIILGDLYY